MKIKYSYLYIKIRKASYEFKNLLHNSIEVPVAYILKVLPTIVFIEILIVLDIGSVLCTHTTLTAVFETFVSIETVAVYYLSLHGIKSLTCRGASIEFNGEFPSPVPPQGD